MWNEIDVVWENVEKIYVNNQYIYDRYNYKIKKTNGEIFNLSNMISNIDELGRHIKEKTLENIYPQIIAKLDNGGQEVFASLTVDKNGVGGIPWTEFSAVKLKEGVIEIKERAGQVLLSGSYGAMPNAHILMVLLKEKLPFEI